MENPESMLPKKSESQIKSIPQIFYDVISRVIPGSVSIIGIMMALDTTISETIFLPFLEVKAFSDSSIFLVMIFLVCAYILGHLFNPIGDLLYTHLLSKIFKSYANVLYTVVNSPEKCKLSSKIIEFINKIDIKKGQSNSQEEKNNDWKEKSNEMDEDYLSLIYAWSDWLRNQDSNMGARLVKLRAEYNLHAELGVAGMVTVLIHIIAIPKPSWDYELIAIAAIVSVLSSLNYLKAFRVFQISVINNYYATHDKSNNSNKSAS